MPDSVGPVAPWVAAALREGTGESSSALRECVDRLLPEQLSGAVPLPWPLPVGPGTAAAHRLPTGLSPATVTCLRLVAIEASGEAPNIHAALAAAGLPTACLDEAEARGVLRVDPTHVRFRHPLVRAVVHQETPPAVRRTLHRALARALTGPQDADRRAWHEASAWEIAEAPPEGLGDRLAAAVHRARARGGHAAAAVTWDRAACLTVDPVTRGHRLVAGAVDAVLAGRPTHAAALLRRAEQLDPADRSGAIARWRAELDLRRGRVRQACDALLVTATSSLPVGEAIGAACAAGEAAAYAGDTARLRQVARATRQLVPRNDRDAMDRDMLLGITEILTGDVGRGVPRLRGAFAALEQLEPVDDPEVLVRASAAARLLGDDVLTHDVAQRAVARAHRTGARAVVPRATEYVVGAALFRGAHEDAIALAEEGMAIAAETGEVASGCRLRAMLGLVFAFRGNEGACRDHADAALDEATSLGLGVAASMAHWAVALVDLGHGRYDAAAHRLAAVSVAGAGSGHPVTKLLSMPHRVEALVHASDPEPGLAREVADAYATWARLAGHSWARALSARCEGLLAADDLAAAHYQAALVHHGHNGRPFDRARTELHLGELLRRGRDRSLARVHLRNAWESFDRLDAGLWEERARHELRAAGETVTVESAGPVLTSLTPQERRIAALVAGGATNRDVAAALFISPRTVDYHLRKVFHRLGISSRVELAHMEGLDAST